MTELAAVTGPNPVYVNPVTQAEVLAEALERLGYTVDLCKSRGSREHPRITLRCGPMRHLRYTEYIFAAPDDDGRFWFWRASPEDPSVMEAVAPITQVSAAASLLARTLPLIGVLRDAHAG